MEREPERKFTRQVQVSMEVVSSEGTLIGYVTAVQKKAFTVDRFVAPDIALDYSFVDTIEGNRLRLTVSEHEIAVRYPPAEGPPSPAPHPHKK
jgi:hypothetical protein